jgi:predicted MFS family arabinose efflux permease
MATVLEETRVRWQGTGLRERGADRRHLPPTAITFLSLFASQAALVVLTPILPRVAAEFGVSTATAGLLRSASGLAAGLGAFALGPVARRVGLRDLLVLGLSGLAAGSVAGAVAPTFAVLIAAQVLIGASLAIVLSAGVAAAAAWAPEDARPRVLSWTLAGQPVAWIVGLPAVGAVAAVGWRWAMLVVPSAGALVALAAARSRPPDPPSGSRDNLRVLLHQPRVAGWAVGELLAYSAWTGTLVFAGALFVESYGVTPGRTGVLLAAGAAAYVPGGLLARRWTGAGARGALVSLALLAGTGVAVFGAIRPGVWASAAVFAALGFLGGARTMVGSAFGLNAAPAARVAITRVRAAALQFGYLIGTTVGGAALAAGGYPGLGFAMAAMFAAATVPHLLWRGRLAGSGDGSALSAGGVVVPSGREPT